MRESITKSGSEQQLTRFNEIYEELKALDLLNDDVSLISNILLLYYHTPDIIFYFCSSSNTDLRETFVCQVSTNATEKRFHQNETTTSKNN